MRQPKYSRWGSGYQGTKPFWAIQTDTAHMAREMLNGVLMNGTIGPPHAQVVVVAGVRHIGVGGESG